MFWRTARPGGLSHTDEFPRCTRVRFLAIGMDYLL
jgi:hypothetical protein